MANGFVPTSAFPLCTLTSNHSRDSINTNHSSQLLSSGDNHTNSHYHGGEGSNASKSDKESTRDVYHNNHGHGSHYQTIPPTAFFSTLVQIYYKKQPIYKAFPLHRVQSFVCRLNNKTLLGGKDYKKDIANVQGLILKHYTLIEQLHIRHKQILHEYTTFIFGNQDEPVLIDYFQRTRELRMLYCSLPLIESPTSPNPNNNNSPAKSDTTLYSCPQLSPNGGSVFNNTSSVNFSLNNHSPFQSPQSSPSSATNNTNNQSDLDWSTLPPDPLNYQSQRWLVRSLAEVQEDFIAFHKPLSCYEKSDITTLLASVYTTLLPRSYRLIYYLKRQCFYMTEEILILQSLFDEGFLFTLRTEYPDVSLEIILTDFNDRFLARAEANEEKYKATFVIPPKPGKGRKNDAGPGKFDQDKYKKDLITHGLNVPNDPNFWSAQMLAQQNTNGGLSFKSLTITPNDELRLSIPLPTDVIDLERFLGEVKLLTPHQAKWLAQHYVQTWAYCDRPPLPSCRAFGNPGVATHLTAGIPL